MSFPGPVVEVNPLVLLLVALSVSNTHGPGSISGAVLLMPFQVNVLGFSCPAVSPTNLIYNVVKLSPIFSRPGVEEAGLLYTIVLYPSSEIGR